MAETAARRRGGADLVLAGLIVAVVAMMVVPLPRPLLDLLLTGNLAASVVVLMVAVYVGDPMRIATFPSILLLTTLVRLGLNVSTTRLILADADAGQVVRAFGSVVVAGNLVVGLIVFAIITVIQFVVVARGAERVAEVAARFALDAMPGKQMAIDADLRAGLLDAPAARRRRSALERESQFYGAMDGAMKFVKGDAIAAIVIVSLNLVGGMVIGIGYRGLSAGEAAHVYSLLSVGEGLVAQLPSLLIAMAAGLVVTRVASEHEGADLGHDIVSQLLAQPRAFGAAALLLAGLALVPGLPLVPFLAMAAAAGLVYLWLRTARRDAAATAQAVAAAGRDGVAIGAAGEAIEQSGVPAVVVRVAADAGWLARRGVGGAAGAGAGGAAILAALAAARRAVADELGVAPPPIQLVASPSVPSGTARLVVGGHEMALLTLSGEADMDAAVLGEAVRGVLASLAHELFGMQEAQALLDGLARSQPALVGEVVPRLASLPLVTEVLRRLLRERVSIADLSAILHALAEHAPRGGDAEALTERVRGALRRQITQRHAGGGAVRVWSVDALIADAVRGAVQRGDGGSYLALEPEIARDIVGAVRRAAGDGPAVVLADADVRLHLRRLIEDELPAVAVLAPHELVSDVAVQSAGQIQVA